MSILTRLIVVVLTTFVFTACDSPPPKAQGMMPQSVPSRDRYPDIGKPTEPCKLNPGQADSCLGAIRSRDVTDPAARASWLRRLNNHWRPWGNEIEREGPSPSAKAAIRLSAMSDIDLVGLRDIGKGGGNATLEVAVARIWVTNGVQEARYKIGGNPAIEDSLYVVISDYDPPNGNPSKSKPMATWAIYGIRKQEQTAVKLGSGQFHFCEMRHPKRRTIGIAVGGCEAEAALAALQAAYGNLPVSKIQSLQEFLSQYRKPLATLEQDPALAPLFAVPNATNLIRAYLQDELTAAIWITCGTGCCSAE